jgi:hypothetical protein
VASDKTRSPRSEVRSLRDVASAEKQAKCKGEGAGQADDQLFPVDNRVPGITSLSLTSGTAGAAAQTLTITACRTQ